MNYKRELYLFPRCYFSFMVFEKHSVEDYIKLLDELGCPESEQPDTAAFLIDLAGKARKIYSNYRIVSNGNVFKIQKRTNYFLYKKWKFLRGAADNYEVLYQRLKKRVLYDISLIHGWINVNGGY